MLTPPEVSPSAQVLGIDLGGTAIKLGRFDHQGQCLQSLTVPTPQPPTPNAVLAALVLAIAEVDPQQETVAIGLGTPGPADADGRIARVAINLGWKDVPLADWLEEKTGKPTILANDANCAGLGECWLGAGRRFQNAILLTLGTGVGGAVILDGKLFVGRDGTAGELGLITLNPDGPDCNSGNSGSLEQYASVQAIRRRTGLEPDELGRRAEAGDPESIAFWEQYGRDLGAGLASIVYILTPEAILIGGGVSASAKFFFPSLQAELERRVLSSSRAGIEILQAELGNQAGIVGAAKLAREKISQMQALGVQPSPPVREKRLQTELTNQCVLEIARFRSTFLARAAHELRSPINSTMSLHQLILSDLCDSPEEERSFVEQAQTSAKKALSLLDTLIRVARAEHSPSTLDIQPVSLATVLGEVDQLIQLPAKHKNLHLTIDPPSEDAYVLADPIALRQALTHLVDAAVYIMREGTIRLATEEDGDRIHITLEDNRPAVAWYEPLNLFYASPQEVELREENDSALPDRLSPPMLMVIARLLVEAMGGQLEIVAVPKTALVGDLNFAHSITATDELSQIRCTFPIATD